MQIVKDQNTYLSHLLINFLDLIIDRKDDKGLIRRDRHQDCQTSGPVPPASCDGRIRILSRQVGHAEETETQDPAARLLGCR